MRATWKPLLFAALLLGLVLNACQIISGLDTVPVIPDSVDAATVKKDAGTKKTDGGQQTPDDTVPSGLCVAAGAAGCPATPCCLPQDTATETVLCVDQTCKACKLPGQPPTDTVKCCSGQPAGPDGKCQGKCQDPGTACNTLDLFCCAPADPNTSANVCNNDNKQCATCKKEGADCPAGNECCSGQGVICKSDKKCNKCTGVNGDCGRTSDCCQAAAGAPPNVCRSAGSKSAGKCGCNDKGDACTYKEDCCAADFCSKLGRCGKGGEGAQCSEDNDCARVRYPLRDQQLPCVGPNVSVATPGTCGCVNPQGPCFKNNDCCGPIGTGSNFCNGKGKCGCQPPGDQCQVNGDCCGGAGDYCNTSTKLCKRSGLNEGCKKNEDCAPSDLSCNVGEEKCCLKPGKSTMNMNECCSKMYATGADGGATTTCK